MPQWIYLYRQWLLRELQLRFRSSALGVAWLVLAAVAGFWCYRWSSLG